DFYDPDAVCMEVERKVDKALQSGWSIDYLTFVPDGEPTLDSKLGKEVSILKRFGIPIAVLTNASIMWRDDVKEDLMGADLVSIKLDAASEDLWRRIDRPHKKLALKTILDGMSEFAEDFKGTIISETMLIDGIRYGNEFEKIADFLASLKRLGKAYVAVPTRPPAERWVKPASEETVNAAFQIFTEKLDGKVECLTGYEGDAFAFTGNAEEDLLGITAVHPMRKQAVEEFLKKANEDWQLVDKLLRESKLAEVEYGGDKYYVKNFRTRKTE
ncbi:MAG: radical SAM protein, partial [Thermoproteota archaeon]